MQIAGFPMRRLLLYLLDEWLADDMFTVPENVPKLSCQRVNLRYKLQRVEMVKILPSETLTMGHGKHDKIDM